MWSSKTIPWIASPSLACVRAGWVWDGVAEYIHYVTERNYDFRFMRKYWSQQTHCRNSDKLYFTIKLWLYEMHKMTS